jgi:hypothetical protein
MDYTKHMLPEALDKMMSIPSFSSMDFSSFMRGLEGALELCVWIGWQ